MEMDNLIYRTIGEYTHFLNTSTGDVLSFRINKEDAEYLRQNWEKPELELDEETTLFFKTRGRKNTRLCRSKLNDLGMDFKFPTMVNLEINRRCSLDCIHCYIGREYLKSIGQSMFEHMPIEKLYSLFNEFQMMGVFLLVFTGGEPFLNIRFAKLIDIANKNGFMIEIFSNLQFLPGWFKEIECSDINIGRIQTSVYSSDPSVHDSITRVKNSWKKTLGNLEFLVSKGYYVEVATPLMSENYKTWESTKKFFLDLRIRQDFSWPIVDEYYPQRKGKSKLNISPVQFTQFVNSNPDFLIRTEFNDPEAPICEAGRSMFCVSSEGDVFPCSQLTYSVGNITTETVTEIYSSEKMQKFRDLKQIDTKLTEAYNYCIGCNYSSTRDVLVQPKFLLDSFEAMVMGNKTERG